MIKKAVFLQFNKTMMINRFQEKVRLPLQLREIFNFRKIVLVQKIQTT